MVSAAARRSAGVLVPVPELVGVEVDVGVEVATGLSVEDEVAFTGVLGVTTVGVAR